MLKCRVRVGTLRSGHVGTGEDVAAVPANLRRRIRSRRCCCPVMFEGTQAWRRRSDAPFGALSLGRGQATRVGAWRVRRAAAQQIMMPPGSWAVKAPGANVEANRRSVIRLPTCLDDLSAPARSSGRGCHGPIVPCSPPSHGICHPSYVAIGWSLRAPCWPGTAVWCAGSGARRRSGPVVHHCRKRQLRSSSAWRERTRPGGMSGSKGSCVGLVIGSPLRLSDAFCAASVYRPHRSEQASRPGVPSSVHRLTRCSLAISCT